MASITKRGNRWRARIFVRETDGGKKQIVHSQSFRTKGEAEAYVREHARDMKRGTYIAPVNTTVADFARQWLDGPAKTRLRAQSLTQYEQKLRTHVLPLIGDYALVSVSLGVIDKLYASLSAKGISPRTIQYAHAVLTSMFTAAVRGGLLAANPCQYATRPKIEREEAEQMTPQEMNAFLSAAADDPWLCYWVMLADTGARPGEILGLRWCDVKGSKVKMTRTAVRNGGAWTFGPPKTKKSKRTVNIPPEAVEALRKHRSEAKKRAAESGQMWDEEPPVFASARGDLPDYRSLVRDHFNPYVKRAALRALTPKAMRHGHVSALLATGMSSLTVAKRVGHASTGMIDEVYGHAGQAEDEGAAEVWATTRRANIKLA